MKTRASLIYFVSYCGFETLRRFSLYLCVSYKFALKSAKGLVRIFCATEYWEKTQKGKICSTNTKRCFRKNEANIETSGNLSPYIGVSYKYVLKSVKCITRIF